jgi:hypothetical protein
VINVQSGVYIRTHLGPRVELSCILRSLPSLVKMVI